MPSLGRIELIIGPMFSGKTTELIRLANRYKTIGKNILAINHKINVRYGTDKICSHSQEILSNCINTDSLLSIQDHSDFVSADIIIIEELQFFEDAFEAVTRFADEYNKVIIAAGLDGDFKRNPFGDVCRLIPHAEKVMKLNALCKECGDGTVACFTKRLNLKDDSQIQVGTNDKFESVCRKHYLE